MYFFKYRALACRDSKCKTWSHLGLQWWPVISGPCSAQLRLTSLSAAAAILAAALLLHSADGCYAIRKSFGEPIWKISFCGFCEQLISKFQCYPQTRRSQKSLQALMMLHYVLSMRFSTIVECYSIIKFWLLYIKEKIKLCMSLREC